ncbi:ArpU family phage packaging/lysis transcriptional regulator [Metasolibacillus meyeri]|uniref:ArpU family phage packaging/lysis transcriptional regulator n=1 Tax=Metasolibacillus meyeri TaxID=1071052 RepID=A0AAW9NSW2_9BACL|nr:ArpU family phage packaging/lysis transcriptional regulator [Metasolibacillus meyeri]MEC1177293.1 ArpU family phage packaging/lysis transcriptional regulator [Metasolibacillus meyeri]
MMERKVHQLSLFREQKEASSDRQKRGNMPPKKLPNSPAIRKSETTEEERERIVEWVLERCIAKYFKMSLRANSKSLPNLTSRISDIPSGRSNDFFSKTEAAAIERVSAGEWLRIFQENLDGLPVTHKEIIEEKYLQREADGRYKSDLAVYQELNLGRTTYYRMKKEALYWLGVRLAEEKIFENVEEAQESD